MSRQAVPVRVLGALLALGIAWIHVVDQGGFPGDKAPRYVGIGYYLLEATAVLLAVALLLGIGRVRTWLVAAGVGFGPLMGYVLSRGPGLPSYTDDRGNWTEPIGLWSLALESTLVLLATLELARARRTELVSR